MNCMGSKNWTSSEVANWLRHDEKWYIEMRRLRRLYPHRVAAYEMLKRLRNEGITQMPDGALLSVKAVHAAMTGM